jgi:hypothetical protein
MMEETKKELERFKAFLRGNEASLFVTLALLLLCYAKHTFTLNVDIDTEDVITGGTSNVEGWLTIGRFGAYYTKLWTGLIKYNPYFSGVLFLCFFFFSAVIWMYNIHRVSQDDKNRYWIFGILYVTSSLWCFIFYFSMLQFELVLGLCLSALASYLLFLLLNTKKIPCFIIFTLFATAFLLWGIASYQAILVYYVVGCIITYLFYYRTMLESNQVTLSTEIKHICYWAVHLIVTYGIYQFLTKKYFSGSVYLESMNNWTGNDFLTVFNGVVDAVKNVYRGEDAYYTHGMLWILVLVLLDMVYRLLFQKENKLRERILYVVVELGLLVSPFLLYIYLGNSVLLRTQFPFALYTGAAAMFFGGNILRIGRKQKKKFLFAVAHVVLCFAVLVVTAQQMETNLRLWYTDDVCNQQDLAVAQKISSDISSLGLGEGYPVVFLGRKQVSLNASCLQCDMFGVSNFTWDYSSPTGSNVRTILYIGAALGVWYGGGDDTQQNAAIEKGVSMPSYPNAGYVSYDGDSGCIIVKLSEY